MEPEAGERLHCAAARGFRIGSGLRCFFRCGIARALRCGLHQGAPRCTEGLLVVFKIEVCVLTRWEDEMFWRATANRLRPLAESGKCGHGFIVQRYQTVPSFGLAAFD